jgi:hypothetical protein
LDQALCQVNRGGDLAWTSTVRSKEALQSYAAQHGTSSTCFVERLEFQIVFPREGSCAHSGRTCVLGCLFSSRPAALSCCQVAENESLAHGVSDVPFCCQGAEIEWLAHGSSCPEKVISLRSSTACCSSRALPCSNWWRGVVCVLRAIFLRCPDILHTHVEAVGDRLKHCPRRPKCWCPMSFRCVVVFVFEFF